MHSHHKKYIAPVLGVLALLFEGEVLYAGNTFKETDLVSDVPGLAAHTDSNLGNPWGIAFSATSAFWISDNHTGLSTLYSGGGDINSLVVTIPGANGDPGAPTGQVFNGGSAFNGDRFIFSGEDGLITGWRGPLGTTAETLFDHSSMDAVYKGLAIGSVGTGTYLYAADFHNNRVDVFPSGGSPSLSGTFSDPSIPAGFAPFNLQTIGTQLFVTYAKQDADAHDDVGGKGNGYVDVYTLGGTLVRRLISGGPLDSPWGLAVAPASFGPFGGDLLVGNFGDGLINVFDMGSGTFIDSLRDAAGLPIAIEGLWGLAFGNGAGAGQTNTLYFTAGISGGDEIEAHGLLGAIAPVPEPGTGMAGIALVGFCGAVWFRRRKRSPHLAT